jgi:hypothetical protein
LLSSVCVSAQNAGPPSVAQSARPAPHALEQLPATQAMVLLQTFPQVPQFRPSDEVSAQYAPPASILQKVLPAPQETAQSPLEQTLPLGQA